jgi:NitT/TauT family transport system permease protein
VKLLAPVKPLLSIFVLVAIWHFAAQRQSVHLLPTPAQVAAGIQELADRGLLMKYIVASLFRVTWGYLLAAVMAVPCGLILGSYHRMDLAMNPLIQIFRPISPLAWIPIAILWFGVGDLSAIFLIFIASFFPLTVAVTNAITNISETQLRAARNFGLSDAQLVRRVLYPAILPQLIAGLRLTLGVAWLVVVAAEMISVNSGLGFLIVDSRNAGNRYDLVVAGMAMIGAIGLILDTGVKSLEKLDSVRWAYSEN